MKKVFFIIFLVSLLSFLAISQAQAGLVPCGSPGQPPCQFCHLFVLFKNIVDFLLFDIVPPLAILMVAIGGGMFFLYAENPAIIEKARSLMKAVVIGLIIIYGAWLIVNLFFQIIGVQDWTGLKRGWWKIDCPN